ncbi:MAG: carbon storage regulator [Pirellulales bacterium]|nr:carbon storage regulator [Pirellulales bacterium]
MLVLSRKLNESVVIGDVTVTVIEIRGDRVRLGIEAPVHVPVHRREVFDALSRWMDEPGDVTLPPADIEPPRSSDVALTTRHIRLIDRLREAIRVKSGDSPSRQQILDAILDSIAQCEEVLREAESQEDLVSLLSDKVDGKPGLFHWLR